MDGVCDDFEFFKTTILISQRLRQVKEGRVATWKEDAFAPRFENHQALKGRSKAGAPETQSWKVEDNSDGGSKGASKMAIPPLPANV